MEKLVRDRMPEICNASGSGFTPMTYRYADPTEMPAFLSNKLSEEVAELGAIYKDCTDSLGIDMDKRDKLIEEIADVLEVVDSILYWSRVGLDEVESAMDNKYKRRGGFINGIIWDGKK